MSPGQQRKLTVRVAAQEASRRELQQALLAWETAARIEGCVREAHVYEDVLSPGVFGAEAKLDSAADLDQHLHSASFGALLGALSVLAQYMDLAICQPTQEFGADAIAIVRRLRAHAAGRSE
jgi:hypothetical protein